MDAVRNIMERLASEGPQYTRQLASSIGVSSEYVRKLCRCLRHHKLIHSEGGMHGITEAGRARLADRYLPCQRKGRAATSEGRTLRQRAWNIMRMRDHFSVDDLLTTLCDGEEKGAEENLRNYYRALYRAGILGMTGRTKAYYLRPESNHGALAPAYNRAEKCVTDRNTGEIIALGAPHE